MYRKLGPIQGDLTVLFTLRNVVIYSEIATPCQIPNGSLKGIRSFDGGAGSHLQRIQDILISQIPTLPPLVGHYMMIGA